MWRFATILCLKYLQVIDSLLHKGLGMCDSSISLFLTLYMFN